MILELKKDLTYGPVRSRRLGASLGINLFPGGVKRCPFDCVYCQYGWTEETAGHLDRRIAALPSPDDVERAVIQALDGLPELPAYLTFSGNGEPTLHPDFPEMVERVNGIRRRLSVETRTAALSNSARVADPAVRGALARLDVRIMKLDCGTEETFRRYNRPAPGLTLGAISDGLRALSGTAPVTIQTLVAGGTAGNLEDDEGRAWIDRLVAIKPAAIQLYTLARGTPSTDLAAAPQTALRRLAEAAAAEGLIVTVF
ncbi:MAG TPA: radical SAM protein [Acidobacteriota bacterium]|nr:radical SAM protein [Acidobacteriota bacterium]